MKNFLSLCLAAAFVSTSYAAIDTSAALDASEKLKNVTSTTNVISDVASGDSLTDIAKKEAKNTVTNSVSSKIKSVTPSTAVPSKESMAKKTLSNVTDGKSDDIIKTKENLEETYDNVKKIKKTQDTVNKIIK